MQIDFTKLLQYTTILKVLYVEDDEDLLNETSEIFEDYFHTVITASNGKEGIEIYKKYYELNEPFDLVITDLTMPIMSGEELIDAINKINSEQTILVMSAHNENNEIIRLIQKGISNFLLKPVSGDLMFKVLFRVAKSIFAQKRLLIKNESLMSIVSSLDNQVVDLVEEIKAIKRLSVETIINLIESYDDDTGSHVKRIEGYTKLLLLKIPKIEKLYSQEFLEAVPFASLLHDTGKFLIPKEILGKPGKLTNEEFAIMKKHTEIGGKILTKANEDFKEKFNKDSYFKIASDIATYHHEKWNGNGYPKGLKEQEIPLAARIVAIADVYDALRSKRVYKPSFSHEKSVEIIKNEKGKSFDPFLTDIFLKHHEKFNEIFLQHQKNQLY
jgi:putative two-component system response regulator